MFYWLDNFFGVCVQKTRVTYIDHDRTEVDKDDADYSNLAWPGFGKSRRHVNGIKSRSVRSQYDSPSGPYDSPPGPYDSPYGSPPGPYDSPESNPEEDKSLSEKVCARFVC